MNGPQRVTKCLLRVLEYLLHAEGREIYGWEIVSRAEMAGPTVYKLLERLALAGWLDSRWEVDQTHRAPPRRYYRLTVTGVDRARQLLAERQSNRIGE